MYEVLPALSFPIERDDNAEGPNGSGDTFPCSDVVTNLHLHFVVLSGFVYGQCLQPPLQQNPRCVSHHAVMTTKPLSGSM